MAGYDRLPADLRAWLAQAALPWSPASALRLWRKGDPAAARGRLDAAEARLLARDAPRVWGAGYPVTGFPAAACPERDSRRPPG